jgi:AraC-like DNA-binding protein
MLNERHKKGLYNLYEVSGVPLLVLDRKGEELYGVPKNFTGFYSSDFLGYIPEQLARSQCPGGILLFCVGDFYYTAFTQLDKDLYLATAIISAETFSGVSARTYTKWCVKPDRFKEFVKILPDLPTLNNYQLALIALLGRQICTGKHTADICVTHKSETGEPQTSLPGKKQNLHHNDKKNEKLGWIDESISSKKPDNDTLNWRIAVYEAIKNGDTERFLSLYRGKESIGIGPRSMDPLRRTQYSYIAFISILNWLIETDRNIPWKDVIRFSDQYCQRMDSMTSPEEITAFKIKTGIDYCKKVWQYKGYGYNTYSAVTRKCCDYIQAHLYNKFTIEKLASYTGLNRHSLAIYFKRDTGMNIPDYTAAKRMEEAAYLLATTKLSILDISQMLRFSSQSYFGKKFKDCFGLTPGKYQDKL